MALLAPTPSGFTPLTYLWTQISGPAVSLSDPTSATPTFVAAQVTTNTDITFQLIVTNSKNVQSSPSYLFVIYLSKMLNSCNVNPVNDLKRSGFLNNIYYENI